MISFIRSTMNSDRRTRRHSHCFIGGFRYTFYTETMYTIHCIVYSVWHSEFTHRLRARGEIWPTSLCITFCRHYLIIFLLHLNASELSSISIEPFSISPHIRPLCVLMAFDFSIEWNQVESFKKWLESSKQRVNS